MPYRVDLAPTGDPAGTFDRLLALGALDIDPLPGGGLAAILPDGVPPQQVASALGLASVRTTQVDARDGGAVWMLGPRPVRAGRLHVVPADWPDAGGALRLLDSPVFGSGRHPTTALCLEALDERLLAGAPGSLLDIGTGSGILALAALRAGVARAVAIDTDARAVALAARNAALNHLADRVDLVRGGPDALGGRWPLVLANILAAPLIELAPVVARLVAHDGQLVLSGIQETLAADVERTYRHRGLQPMASRTRDGWAALTLRASW